MNRKSKGAPPRGQRSIASFVFKKETQPDVQNDLASGSAPAASVPPPSANADEDTINLTNEEDLPPSKRLRQEETNVPAAKKFSAAAPAKPNTSTTTPLIEAEARHQRWQSKLVGDESAGMQRVRTQEALENRKDSSGAGISTAAAAPSTSSQKMTPLELQVAALQRKHSDCVLCIECGYKYRFFGKDAEIASAVLGIFSYPDRNYLTCAVPTFTIDRHVRRLVLAGHKVGVVRQTESAAIKAAGDNRNKPFERKLAAVYTRATLEAGALAAGRPLAAAMKASTGDNEGEEDEANVISAGIGGRVTDAAYGNEHNSAFLICIIEGDTGSDTSAKQTTNTTEIGLVALETSTGEVYYSEFSDSPMRAELESKLMFTHPSEMLLVTPLSSPTRRLLEAYGSGSSSTLNGPVRTESVSRIAYSSGGALSAVVDFYKNNENSTSASSSSSYAAASGLDAVMKLPPLVLRALAHALDHLRPFGLQSILRLGASFQEFSQVQELSLSPNSLAQLEILRNSDSGKERGSLLWVMDRTLTAAGARLIRRWVSRPLRDVEIIEQRLDAVEELVNNTESRILSALPGVLKELPDVERILGRVLHTTSSPTEFLTLLQVFRDLYLKLGLQADLDALHAAVVVYNSRNGGNRDQQNNRDADEVEEERENGAPPLVSISTTEVSSALLRKELMSAADLRCAAVAQSIMSSLDVDAAAAGDKLKLFADPERFPDVEARRAAVIATEAELDTLRPQLAQILNIKAVNYVSIANQGDYLVEIPVDLAKRAPKSWEKVSSTKRAARFRPPEVKKCLSELILAKEHLAITANKAWIRLQIDFSEQYIASFQRAGRALATLDCLNSFAGLAVGSAQCYVRPKFVESTAPPQLHITEGRHPVLDVLLEGSFVPNDIHLQGSDDGGDGGTAHQNGEEQQNEKERCAVITGPNMGGKSCYIRQAALIACMAQAGSFVPATACHLHALDAIYTRMGASDNLALGRSTFLEELGEASTILANATPYSLAIFDELGRGTSTRDGKAIAAATLDYICRDIRCLTLFVTHYPEVALQSKEMKGMGSYYMAHVVENKEEKVERLGGKVDDLAVPKVTFLYKAVRGVAEASYGLNVARMAGLPENVVMKAAQKAREIATAAGEHPDARECVDDESLIDDGSLTKVSGDVATKLREIKGSGRIIDVDAVIQLQERVKNALYVA